MDHVINDFYRIQRFLSLAQELQNVFKDCGSAAKWMDADMLIFCLHKQSLDPQIYVCFTSKYYYGICMVAQLIVFFFAMENF